MTEADYESRKWQLLHKSRRRAHLRKWYYRRRGVINLAFSRPSSGESDIADLYINRVDWNPFI